MNSRHQFAKKWADYDESDNDENNDNETTAIKNKSSKGQVGVLTQTDSLEQNEPLLKSDANIWNEKLYLHTPVSKNKSQYVKSKDVNLVHNTNTRCQTIKVRVSKQTLQRKSWKKFGKCSGQQEGPEDGITFVGEEIKLNLFCQTKEAEEVSKIKEMKTKIENITVGKVGKYIPVHLRANASTLKPMILAPIITEETVDLDDDEAIDQLMTLTLNSKTIGKYIPIHMRNKRAQMKEYDKQTTTLREVKVDGLPEDTTLHDFRKLLQACGGEFQRPILPRCRITGLCRGFGFCIFENHETAQNAVKKLDGHRYGYKVLHAFLQNVKDIQQDKT